MHELERRASSRVARTLARAVHLEPTLDVVGHAAVQRRVLAAQHVDPPAGRFRLGLGRHGEGHGTAPARRVYNHVSVRRSLVLVVIVQPRTNAGALHDAHRQGRCGGGDLRGPIVLDMTTPVISASSTANHHCRLDGSRAVEAAGRRTACPDERECGTVKSPVSLPSRRSWRSRAHARRGDTVLAVEDPDTEIAKRHFAAGAALYDQGKYNDAIVEFSAARDVRPAPAFDFNIARCYDRLERLRDAVTWYERYLATDPPLEGDGGARARGWRILEERIGKERARVRYPVAVPVVLAGAAVAFWVAGGALYGVSGAAGSITTRTCSAAAPSRSAAPTCGAARARWSAPASASW